MKALLLLLNVGKLGKVLLSGGTMLLSLFTYALVFGWPYAAGFIALLFAHEMGHYIAARKRGLPVGLPTFIPFLGAWIDLKQQPLDAETEAFIGLAGPIVGSAAAYLCFLLARENDSRLLLAISYSGFMLNLFNLIPLTPLDGGRIVAVISPRIWWVGIPVLVGLFFWRPSPMLILIAIMAAPRVLATFKGQGSEPPGYFEARSGTRLQYSFDYIALLLFLALMSYETHEALAGHRP